MTKIEILPNESEPESIPDSLPEQNDRPEEPVKPATLSFELEGEVGEAVFAIPTVRHIKLVEREKNLQVTDQLRKLAKACLISWAGRDKMPSEDEIDAFDDQEMTRLMLRQVTGVDDENIDDETLMEMFAGGSDDSGFEVLPDKSHRVHLSVGSITLRRLNQKDIKRVEVSAQKSGGTTTDVLTACSVCTEWWGSGKRNIMPADFDPIPLSEFRRVSNALAAFLKRSKRSK